MQLLWPEVLLLSKNTFDLGAFQLKNEKMIPPSKSLQHGNNKPVLFGRNYCIHSVSATALISSDFYVTSLGEQSACEVLAIHLTPMRVMHDSSSF